MRQVEVKGLNSFVAGGQVASISAWERKFRENSGASARSNVQIMHCFFFIEIPLISIHRSIVKF